MARLPQRLGLNRYEADEHYRQALEAFRKGRFDAAIMHMNDAIALLPNKAEYYATRGFFYVEDGVVDKAEADFGQALKLYPYEMLAHYGRGMIAFKDKKWDEALAHFSEAYKADPKRPETLYYLALAYHRKGGHDTALRLMQAAQAAFEGVDDRRKSDAAKWVKELQKVIDNAAAPKLTSPEDKK